jgi:hypothetical protein
MKKTVTRIFLLPVLIFISLKPSAAQTDEQKEIGSQKEEETVKSGWTFGGVPAISYDRDVGFRYGAIVNFYDFGDGSRYPKYDHSIFLQYSRTTRGSTVSQFAFDSDRLIPGIRTASEIIYETEQALDFYGFNGYQSKYNASYENDEDPVAYLSRMFFRHDRKLLRVRAEFTGDLIENRLKWIAGAEYFNNIIDTVDITRLNKRKSAEDLLPDVEGGLYQKYIDWGLIPSSEKNGGMHTLLKVGIVYDTRDNEPNPMKGIWTDAILVAAPGFLGNRDMTYGKIALTHRQYFTLINRNLNFAYRLSYQGKLFGEIPYYMLPFIFNSPPNYTRDGLGGGKTIRGVLRNRVVGEDYFYGNAEFRWKFVHTRFLRQNFHIALSTFLDAGKVVGDYSVDPEKVPETFNIGDRSFARSDFFNEGNDSLHLSAGGGIHFVLNENFVVAVDYGLAFRPEDDGGSGLYIGLNWLY